MILHDFVHSPLDLRWAIFSSIGWLARLQSRHQSLPVWLDDFRSTVVEQLLNEHQHSRSERPTSALPLLDLRVLALVLPREPIAVVRPGADEEGLEVAEREEETEKELVWSVMEHF